MPVEDQGFIFGVYDEECTDLPSGSQVDALIRIIKDHPGRTKMELWNELPVPKGMNYSAFSNILCALAKRDMVTVDREAHVSWTDRS
jgi:hypothetical protein